MSLKCYFCPNEIENLALTVFNIAVITDKDTYIYGLPSLIDKMSIYLFVKGIKLSSTEILLMRPDVFYDYLITEEFKTEEVLAFSWIPYTMCKTCYEEYKKLLPLK